MRWIALIAVLIAWCAVTSYAAPQHPAATPALARKFDRLGVTVRALTYDEGRQANLSSGLYVDQAVGNAAQAGIEPTDIILSVDGATVKSVGELAKMVSQDSKQIGILAQRGNEKIFLPVRMNR